MILPQINLTKHKTKTCIIPVRLFSSSAQVFLQNTVVKVMVR